MDSQQRKELGIIGVIILIMTLLAILGILCCGCNSQSTQQTDKLQAVEKKQEEQDLRIKGNENQITTMKTDIKVVTQNSEKNSLAIQQGFGVNADEIGSIDSNVNNTKNSPILIAVLFGMNLLTFAGLFIAMMRAKGR